VLGEYCLCVSECLIHTGRGSACNSRQYAEAKIKLWKDLGLEDNSTQNERMWPLMYNYKYESKYADQPADIHVDIYVSSITNVV